MKTVFIYVLKDPVSGIIRYVGKSRNPNTRLRAHLCKSRLTDDHRSCWIKSLSDQGKRPILEVLDEVEESEWQACEAAYIQFFRESGLDLTNTTDGGEGASGYVFSEQHRIRLSKSLKGNKNSLGSVQTEEHIAKRVAANMGNKYGLGHRHSDESREKMRLVNLGRQHTKESRAKMCVSQKISWQKRKAINEK